jgi:hypothetical protein
MLMIMFYLHQHRKLRTLQDFYGRFPVHRQILKLRLPPISNAWHFYLPINVTAKAEKPCAKIWAEKSRRCSSQDCKCLPCIRSAGQLSVLTRIARYFLVQHTKNGKKYELTIKYTKWKYKIPKCNKIDQMVINIPTSSIARPSKIYPNWDFLLENMPSGNPARGWSEARPSAAL